MAKRCGNCGSYKLMETDTNGPFIWKDFPAVHIKKSVLVLKCGTCSETIISLAAGQKIDQFIEESICENVKKYIIKILEREETLQIELSSRLGVTPEYLSEIKSGRKIPSFQTYNFLKVLALNGKAYRISDPKNKIA